MDLDTMGAEMGVVWLWDVNVEWECEWRNAKVAIN